MMTLKDLKKLIEEIESKVGVPADRIQVTLEPFAEPYVVAGAFIKMDDKGNCPDMQDGVYMCVYPNGRPWDVTTIHAKTEKCRTFNFSTRRGNITDRII